MSDARGLSRRSLLGVLGAGGVSGFGLGTGTTARVSDSENLGGFVQAAEFDIEIAVGRGEESPREFGDHDRPTVSFGEIDPGDTGQVIVAVRSVATPASTRFGVAVGDDSDGPLLAAMDSEITVTHPGQSGRTVYSGPLRGAIRAFEEGFRLETCVVADPTEIVLRWSLPADAPPAVYGETVSLFLPVWGRPCDGSARGDRNPPPGGPPVRPTPSQGGVDSAASNESTEGSG